MKNKILKLYVQAIRYRLEFDYDEQAKDELKQVVLPQLREYDPDLTTWYVSKIAGIEIILQRWAQKYFDMSILIKKQDGKEIEYDFLTGVKKYEQKLLFNT